MKLLFVCLAWVSVTCTSPEKTFPLYEDLSRYHFKVSTSSERAQAYFDQGFSCYYGFNHEFGIESFQEALRHDSTLAMAWWGQALSVGPNINNPIMDSSAVQFAWEALQQAQRLSQHASEKERDLIGALAVRYSWPAPTDRRPLDIAYADAMRRLWKKYPRDIDVGALFADAMLNLRPWDLWTPYGEPRPETAEIVSTLETLLAMDSRHPGACHFYIHTMEASPWPEKALAAADSLRHRIPGSGHLVHMPSHIDIRLGKYEDAIAANRAGIAADRKFAPRGGFYSLYRAHNFHFLAYAAMFDGQKAVALQAAHDIKRQLPAEMIRQYADFLEGFYAVPTHVQVRFGMWDEILGEPKPPSDFFVTTAFWRYGRTVALSALGRTEEAARELDSLYEETAAIPDSRTVGNNTAKGVMAIGLRVARGEYEFRKGNTDRAFKILSEAVRMDDSLRYDEPWGWMMPVRHALGALLVDREMYREALKVYEEDLSLHPQNGWSLLGKALCLEALGDRAGAGEVHQAFRRVWARSDVQIKASCFCSDKGARGM